ncbi:phospholipase D-like domain-containing protein [Pseudobacteriovorax antillogorgiicola]|uniref:phospholipase D n=1 Tax=Pseudobacteriovorax antillogorgiicola TaxID=1513793 RepID=A0A1Y6BBD2_9BACT|nr:phosphatidylserine/phosphatidylglycerophosphate/cardiolipin synthase family protein [Pseudobacteriovorax antillogorgiicola]TCS57451.1 phosphatidylserine/phosphatidylglycerophosphate/cardiolipin synthase-like enzyme [Pseudobacteriovorax antillogorgiicola]SMF00888.1 Phosphatidylserine/phosphatidylglycerophosphate/cardiolipin synthase [Pseudobacteriovorax antillogorgiicola]
MKLYSPFLFALVISACNSGPSKSDDGTAPPSSPKEDVLKPEEGTKAQGLPEAVPTAPEVVGEQGKREIEPGSNDQSSATELNKPLVKKPEVKKTEVKKPEVEKPEVEKPEVVTPVVETPVVEKPEVATPVVKKPEVEPNLETRVIFAPSRDKEIEKTIIESIKAAKNEIKIAMYSFSNREIKAALKEKASDDSVKIRVLINNDTKYTLLKGKTICSICTDFENAGIEVRYNITKMHHKFAVIDNNILLSGSANWSSTTLDENDSKPYDEDFFKTRKAELVGGFSSEFTYIWNNAAHWNNELSNGTDVTFINIVETEYQPSDLVRFTSSNFKKSKTTEGRWSKVGSAVASAWLIEAIDSARSEIKIATTHYNRPDIHQAIIQAFERGVKVQLVTDGGEYAFRTSANSNVDRDLALILGDDNVRFKRNYRFHSHKIAQQMHSKYMVVDNSAVYTGSYNWSETAETGKFENLVKFTHPAIVKSYSENFNKIFNYNRGDALEEFKKDIMSQQGSDDSANWELCRFSVPFTLSSTELTQLFDLFRDSNYRCKP